VEETKRNVIDTKLKSPSVELSEPKYNGRHLATTGILILLGLIEKNSTLLFVYTATEQIPQKSLKM